MKAKKIVVGGLLCLILLLILCTGTAFYFLQAVDSDDNASVVFKVEKGTALLTVLDDLKAKGLIHSTKLAYAYARYRKILVKAGTYKLSKSMDTAQILENLTKGTQKLVKITLPEGLTLNKTAKILAQSGMVDEQELLNLAQDPALLAKFNIDAKSCEGFLFPDTYFFGEEDSALTVITTIIQNFFDKTSKIDGFPKNKEELMKTVILASIVEREYRVDDEAKTIAGVFKNRLDIGMGLESCATVEYVITEVLHKPHPERLFNVDLEIKNPYNTYMYAGLPPGPISNPGLTSLKAATSPEKHDYLFFRLVNTETGAHAFSKTFDEHTRINQTIILKKAAGK